MSAGRLVRRPFKSAFFYEWQIGPFVFQVRHTKLRPNEGRWSLFQVWRDSYWRDS